MAYVIMTSMSILLNGSTLQPFKWKRVLDWMILYSLYLFILLNEALVMMFWNTKSKGYLAAMKVGKNKVKFKHLQFLDDTLLFVPRDEGIPRNYFCILDVSNVMSGFRLHNHTSSVITWKYKDSQ